MESSGFRGGYSSRSHEARLLDLGPLMISSNENQMNLMGCIENKHDNSPLKGFPMSHGKGKGIDAHNSGSASASDEDGSYPTENAYAEHCSEAKGKYGSPWHRMKWTDDVIKLLISVVASVDDDGLMDDGTEGLKRKYGCLQKKGKWKTVSKIMISKGCHVSPQQCEDKFNDLNKRYKKLNDILGRGTSCSVVENPSLMDSMHEISAKAKDEVKKILSSKHLFYKEMCAYHNRQRLADCHDLNHQVSALVPLEESSREIHRLDEEHDGKYSNDERNDSDSDGEDEDDGDEDSENEVHERGQLPGLACFQAQISRVFRDPTKTFCERKEWIKKQKMDLLKQRTNLQAQAFELEKRRFKWMRYCIKKDVELERLKMEIETRKLENEQGILQLKQKGLEIGWRRPGPHLDITFCRVSQSAL